MLEAVGDMWELECDARCITTNGVVHPKKTTVAADGKRVPKLVMGGGCAREAADRFPEIAIIWGEEVLNKGNHAGATPLVDDGWLIRFPTKEHPTEPSYMWLIEQSCRELMDIVQERGFNKVLLPRPGCGLGGLDWEQDVKPKIEALLDDRVVVVDNTPPN